MVVPEPIVVDLMADDGETNIPRSKIVAICKREVEKVTPDTPYDDTLRVVVRRDLTTYTNAALKIEITGYTGHTSSHNMTMTWFKAHVVTTLNGELVTNKVC